VLLLLLDVVDDVLEILLVDVVGGGVLELVLVGVY
jgi:hypothetical protein